MRRFWLFVIGIFAFIILFCGSAFASEDFLVTFASQNVDAGHESSAIIEALNPLCVIDRIVLKEQYHENSSATLCSIGYDLFFDSDGTTVTFTPLYNEEAWIEIYYTDATGDPIVYFSDRIKVTNGIHISVNEPEHGNYIYPGDTYTVKYIISGGSGSYTVKPRWSVYIGNLVHYFIDVDESYDSMVTVSYKPTSQITSFNWLIDVIDSNGARCSDHRGVGIFIIDDNLWAEPEYTWSEDYTSVTATCYYNLEVYEVYYTYAFIEEETVDATVTTIPATIDSEGSVVYRADFSRRPFTTQIHTETIPRIDTIIIDGIDYKLFRDTKTATVLGPEKRDVSKINIPDTIKAGLKTYKIVSINEKAFSKLSRLSSVSLGKNIKKIGMKAFYSCPNLKTVKGGSGLKAVDDWAFFGCKVLKSFPILSQLQKIGSNAFKGCAKLPKFTISAKVKLIGNNAFNGCKSLKTIDVKTIKLNENNVGNNAFKGIYKNATFKCPAKKLKAYQALFVKKGAPKTCRFK